MAALAWTYTTLKEKLLSFTDEDSGDADIVGDLDTIIQIGEDRCLGDLDLTIFDAESSPGNFTVGNNTLTLPPGSVKANEVWYVDADGKIVALKKRTREYLRDYWPNTTATGAPKFWTEKTSTTLMVAPTPAAALAWCVSRLARPDSIVSAGSTWLGTNVPDLLLKACLAEMEGRLAAHGVKKAWNIDYGVALRRERFRLRSLRRRDDRPHRVQNTAEAGPAPGLVPDGVEG